MLMQLRLVYHSQKVIFLMILHSACTSLYYNQKGSNGVSNMKHGTKKI